MTIRTNNNNNNNSNNKSFASSAPSTEETDAVAFNVNADDVCNEDNNIPFVHASSVVVDANAAHQTTTPIAYSTGKPPQPPPPQPLRSSSSSSVAVATGAPTPIPTPTSTTTQTTSTSTTSTTSTTRGNNNSQNCCTGWTCCGIISIVLVSIFVCCILPFIIAAIAMVSATANSIGAVDYDDDDYYYIWLGPSLSPSAAPPNS